MPVGGGAAGGEGGGRGGREAPPVRGLLWGEGVLRASAVRDAVFVAVALRLLVALPLAVDAPADREDDPDEDPDPEDPDCCDKHHACHVWRPLTCRPAVSPPTGPDLGCLSDTGDTGQTVVGN